jgi:hypothetical protein
MQPNALLVRQNFIICKKWVLHKHGDANVNLSSSTCAVDFAQTNLHTSGPSAGGTTMPNTSSQSVNVIPGFCAKPSTHCMQDHD